MVLNVLHQFGVQLVKVQQERGGQTQIARAYLLFLRARLAQLHVVALAGGKCGRLLQPTALLVLLIAVLCSQE